MDKTKLQDILTWYGSGKLKDDEVIELICTLANDKGTPLDRTYVKTIKFNGKKLTLHKFSDNPMKVLFYLNTMKGESYIDINTIISDNMLIGAIWVKIGGEEEKIANEIDILQKTNRTTVCGYNNYAMYSIAE